MKIKSIKWERIYLRIELDESLPQGYTMFITNGKKTYPLSCEGREICINITMATTIKGEELLYNGEWSFFYRRDDNEKQYPILIEGDLACRLEELDRVFSYWEGLYAYIVVFGAEEYDGELRCVMRTSYMRQNNKPHKEYIFMEAKNYLPQICKKMMLSASKGVFNFLYKVFCMLRKKDGHHILLMSQTKKALASNLETIDKRLKERGLHERFRISYSFKETLHMSSIAALIYWAKLIFLLAKQDFVLVDDYVPIFKNLPLDKRTKLIQVWHAGLGFKSVGYSRFGKKGSPRPLDSCHRNYDYVIVGSKNLIPVYQEVFGLGKEKFLPLGVPRIDDFLNRESVEEYRNRFYNDHPQLKDKKLILFAPTYRGSGQQEAYYPYEKLDLKQIFEFCGESSVFVFKMHPFIKEKPKIEPWMTSRILDFSEEDVNKLLHVCDVLITDYSSVIYEFVLLERPILFYAFDEKKYNAIRGFHWDFERYAPGRICKDFESLMKALKTQDYGEERRIEFQKFGYDFTDTHSTDRLIDRLFLEEKPLH